MNTLSVGLPDSRYDILIGKTLLPGLGKLLTDRLQPGRVAVVTDETVWGLHGEAFTKAMEGFLPIDSLTILPPGESSKSLEGLGRLYAAFAGAGLGRDGLAIAFGGGVVGDLTGFAAATYMRGIAYVGLPTTLLAQVDSSVGGKTAINLEQGKNLAGAFYQPRLVVADISLLRTLSPRDYAGGMAEVIKYGAIRSRELWDVLAAGSFDVGGIVSTCCAIKSGIVERDERDTGERMILNFGHTFGHAAETLGGFAAHNHGEAVAMGMVVAAAVGEILGITQPGCREKLQAMLASHRLPCGCPYPTGELMEHIQLDKKSGSDGVKAVLLTDIGEATVHKLKFPALRDTMERTETLWRI
jgi:3-dehydroquinate synthase